MMFSVIIPTYNRSNALKRCLESLVNQTYRDFEVIICDDGSSDKTAEVVRVFQSKLNLSYEYSENWGGPARPRNRGISLAKGKWICFLDSDDWWKENKLEEIGKNIQEKYNIYYHPLVIVNSQKELGIIRCRKVNNKNPKLDLLINLNTLLTSSVCVESTLLKSSGGFSLDKEIIGLEDYKFWIDLGGIGGAFKRIDTCLGYYFIGDSDNITLEDARQIKRFEQLYLPYINDPNLIKFKKRIIGSLDFHTGRIIQDAKQDRTYIKYLYRTLLNASFRVKLMALKRLFKF